MNTNNNLRQENPIPRFLMFLLLVWFIALCFATCKGAETNITSELTAGGKDLYADFLSVKPLMTNGNATARFGVGANLSDGRDIEAMMVTMPVTKMLSAGVIVAHTGSTWYEGGASLALGTTKTFPVVGTVQAFAGDGMVYDFISRSPANYAFAGFEKDWKFSEKFTAGIGAVTANTSDRPGVDVLFGFHVTYWWNK